eukprot:TRINITY_DN6748_c0_g2_i1.p1 TRINITY_DN6748_c0_g2~~TRINITY_DN6748_c0_g2_i1.p1  ORF type:complete len:446 (-),score=84.61 TRINITY_DN6748_c0_g2_i1:80-1417(-)
MSMLVKCSFMGEDAVIGCGLSNAARDVETELVFSVPACTDEKMTGMKESKPDPFASASTAPSSTAFDSTPLTKGNATSRACDDTFRGQFPERDGSVWYSCDSEVQLEEFLRTLPKNRTGKKTVEATEFSEPSTSYVNEEAASSSSSCGSGSELRREEPTIPLTSPSKASASTVQDRCIAALRERLSDLLGPLKEQSEDVASISEASASARESVKRFGGYVTCCWRFLRACDNDIDAAEQKLRNTFEFRRTMGLNSILTDAAATEVWEELKDSWPEVILGSSKDGSPVSYFDLEKAVAFVQSGLTEDRIRTFWLVWMEMGLKLQREGKSRASDKIAPQDMPGTVVVYNLESLRLSQLTSCLSGLHTFCRVIGLAEEHYPQNLRKAIIINVPMIFGKMVWPLVQKVLGDETASNVCVSSGSWDEFTSEDLGFSLEELTTLMKGSGRA